MIDRLLTATCLDCGETYEKPTIEHPGDHVCKSSNPVEGEVFNSLFNKPVDVA